MPFPRHFGKCSTWQGHRRSAELRSPVDWCHSECAPARPSGHRLTLCGLLGGLPAPARELAPFHER
eukprot:1403562-Alexandrium_andersonii.AAC.1